MCTGADAIVNCLEAENVDVIFGIPGATIAPFYNALSKSRIKHILVRNEQSAGHSASGYARITRKPAVCVATSGPGALNLITAIATAYMDSIPLIIITGQVSTDLLGRDVFQEADITGSAEPFVKHSYLIKKVEEIPLVFKSAFHIASTGRQGPVLIDIPVDIQNASIDFKYPSEINIRSYKPSVQGHMGQIKRVLTLLKKAKKPLLCAGGGVFSSNSQDLLLALSKKANIPIVTTMMGLGAVSPNYNLNLGMIGMYGCKKANYAMNESDCIILVGARVGDRAIMSPIGLSQNATIIHIDIDPAEIGKNIITHIKIVGSIDNILKVLYDNIKKKNEKCWIEKSYEEEHYIENENYINPQHFLRTLMQKANSDAIIVSDVGQNQIWTAKEYAIENGRFLASCGMGTMGYSLPCAIGAYLADKKRQVIAICGDGGFQMCMAELSTIVDNNINIKIILMNNNCLGLVKELQNQLYKKEQAVLLNSNPDFTLLSSAYGIKATKISSDKQIDKVLDKFLLSDKPFILECLINPDEKTI